MQKKNQPTHYLFFKVIRGLYKKTVKYESDIRT